MRTYTQQPVTSRSVDRTMLWALKRSGADFELLYAEKYA